MGDFFKNAHAELPGETHMHKIQDKQISQHRHKKSYYLFLTAPRGEHGVFSIKCAQTWIKSSFFMFLNRLRIWEFANAAFHVFCMNNEVLVGKKIPENAQGI